MAVTDAQSDFETSVQEDRMYVTTHVVTKMVEAGALLTPPIYGVVSLARKRPLSAARLLHVNFLTTFGVLAPLGAVMATARLWNEPGYAIQDRAYRLRESASQNRVDSLSVIGMTAGAAGGAFLPARFGNFVPRVAGGGLVGVALGVLAHLATMTREEGVRAVKEGAEDALPVKAAKDVIQQS